MSASTVSITANTAAAARRRPVEKRTAGGVDVVESGHLAANPTTPETTNSGAKLTAGDTAAAILRDSVVNVRKPPPTSANPASGRRTGARKVSKPEKPRWLTVVSILSKNLVLLLVLSGLVQMIRMLVSKSGDSEGLSAISGSFEGQFAEMEKFVKKAVGMMQLQVETIEKDISNVKREFDEKLDKKGEEIDAKFKELDVTRETFEKFMGKFESKSLLSKEEFDEFFEEFKEAKKMELHGGGEVSLDEIRGYAKEIVEKEIERHAADGLGMVDYAVESGGGRVVRHSEAAVSGTMAWLMSRNRVHGDAQKMLRPSFGEPGQCFALKGNSGFVEIRLRTAIIPEAVTLEHVAKNVAYDRSSAPKHCRVSGWRQGQDLDDLTRTKMVLLTEFMYDLEKSNAQTYNVLDSAASSVVDTIRLDFTSNHGSASHTCIYRLRVHGREPNSILPVQDVAL